MDPLVQQTNNNQEPFGATPGFEPLTPPVQSAQPTFSAPGTAEVPVMPVPEAPVQPIQSIPEVPNFANDGLSETAPLTMPEAPKAPDPVEEELKAPLTPAAPVPGSIGSAISGPAVAGTTPSVAFNDPAEQNMMAENAEKKPAKKKLSGGKMNKSTLILLCIVGGMVIIVLAAILIGMSQGWF